MLGFVPNMDSLVQNSTSLMQVLITYFPWHQKWIKTQEQVAKNKVALLCCSQC